MKPYLSPPVWMALGFLTGGLHFQPGIVIGVIWAVAHFAMLIWIMRDIETAKPPRRIE